MSPYARTGLLVAPDGSQQAHPRSLAWPLDVGFKQESYVRRRGEDVTVSPVKASKNKTTNPP
jgi:hypothetical protein